ncbi:hypothetical protein Holit_02367 [Hollandina sp. SP2]
MAFAEVDDVTITGTAQLDNGGVAVKITLYNVCSVGVLTHDDLKGWFTNLPTGLSATAQADTPEGGQEITVTIAGTPTAASRAELRITIPGEALDSGEALTIRSNPAATFAIGLPPASAAVGDVSLASETDRPLNGEVVITLTNETFQGITQGQDLRTWFTNLPGTLSATATAAPTNNKILTIQIGGTPTVVSSSASLNITIPGASLSRGGTLAVTANNKATLTVSENSMTGIHLVGEYFDGVDNSIGKSWKYTKAGTLAGELAEIPKVGLFNAIVLDGDDIRLGGYNYDADSYAGKFIYQKNDTRLESNEVEPWNGVFLTLDGDDVYMLAEYTNQLTYNIFKISQNAFSPGTQVISNSSVNGMVRVGDDLYLGGYTRGPSKAAYWKIAKTNLASVTKTELAGDGSVVQCMAVSGNTIYLGGYETIESVTYGAYWILNTGTDAVEKVSLGTGVVSSVFGIAVSGNQVYLTGYWKNHTITPTPPDRKGSYKLSASYWKGPAGTIPELVKITDNATPVLSSGSKGDTGHYIAVDGTDVYVAGNSVEDSTTAGYWKIPGGNGTPQWVPMPEKYKIHGMVIR